MSGFEGGAFLTAAMVSAVTLVWAGLRAAWPVIRENPERFRALDHETLKDMQDDPVLLNQAPHVGQAVTFSQLVGATRENAERLVQLERELSAAYGWFAAGLAAAGVTVVALVVSLV